MDEAFLQREHFVSRPQEFSKQAWAQQHSFWERDKRRSRPFRRSRFIQLCSIQPACKATRSPSSCWTSEAPLSCGGRNQPTAVWQAARAIETVGLVRHHLGASPSAPAGLLICGTLFERHGSRVFRCAVPGQQCAHLGFGVGVGVRHVHFAPLTHCPQPHSTG
jgi:hypothetical protein